MTTPTRYKLTLSPPTDTDPPTNPIWTVDDQIGINPPFRTASQIVTVWDFLSAPQIVDVQTRALTLDLSAAIQTGIDYVIGNAGARPMGTLFFPAGSYRIEDTLAVTAPIQIIGAGCGSGVFPFTQPPTEIAWYGTNESMLIFGSNGAEPFSGGGVFNLCLNGRSLAFDCLRIVDAVRGEFKNLSIIKGKETCLTITNSPGVVYPTAFHVFENLLVETAVTGADTCVGINIDGDISGGQTVAGVAGCSFDQLLMQTDQGAGIRVGNRGDNFLWKRLTINGQNYVTGPGIWFTATDPAVSICDGHIFIGLAVTNGLRFDGPGCTYATQIIDLDMTDLVDPALRDPNVFVSGVAAQEVSINGSLGNMWGKQSTGSWKNTQHHDGMQFVFWDSGNNILHTAMGAWGTDVSASGTVADADQPGGAVVLTTDANANDHAAIFDAATIGSGGLSIAQRPNAVFVLTPIATTAALYRVGWMDTLTDPPTNGIYAEYDPTKSSRWRFICRTGGNETAVLSAYDAPTSISQIKIETSNNPVCANFAARKQPNAIFENPKSITTNVPSGSTYMNFCAMVITTTTAAKALFVYDHKLGYQTEE